MADELLGIIDFARNVVPVVTLGLLALAGALFLPLTGGGILLWLHARGDRRRKKLEKVAIEVALVPFLLFFLGMAGLVLVVIMPWLVQFWIGFGG